jgi:hypothetical protein
MKKLLIAMCLFVLFGCKTNEIVIVGGDATKTNTVDKIALICSLTKVDKNAYNGWDGDCPGTDVDAKVFANLCTDNNIPYIKIENSQCTSQNIYELWVSAIRKLNPNGGLFIFYYSGHGGQVYSNTEADKLDETLCLWNGQLRDDDVWKLLNLVPKTCRIFMVTDCCNSGTNYQIPFMSKKSKLSSRSQDPNMLHFGGCGDGESSYGSKVGGVFTRALRSTYNKNISYIDWFNKSINIMTNSRQKPTVMETGKSFKNLKIFN